MAGAAPPAAACALAPAGRGRRPRAGPPVLLAARAAGPLHRAAALLLLVLISAVAGQEPQRYRSKIEEMAHNPPAPCKSHGGFPAFAKQGKLPGPANDLTLCRGYRLKTCCGAEQTNAIRRTLHFMAVDRASEACRDAWQTLQCARCDPRAGTQRSVRICGDVCDRTFEACKADFFAIDGGTQLLAPCRGTDTICSQLRDFAAGGAAMCGLAGFEPVDRGSSAGIGCVTAVEPNDVIISKRERNPFAKADGTESGLLSGGFRWGVVLLFAGVAAAVWPQWHKQRKQRRALEAMKARVESARARQQAQLSAVGGGGGGNTGGSVGGGPAAGLGSGNGGLSGGSPSPSPPFGAGPGLAGLKKTS